MFVVVWEYRVKPGSVPEFESLYHPDGEWSDLFRQGPGFIGITRMKDLHDSARYMIADRWKSLALYEEFRREHAADYAALSERGSRLIDREIEIGRFDFVDGRWNGARHAV